MNPYFGIERRVFAPRIGFDGTVRGAAPVIQVLGTVEPDPDRPDLLRLKIEVLDCDSGQRFDHTSYMTDPLRMIGGGYIDCVIDEVKHRLRKTLSARAGSGEGKP